MAVDWERTFDVENGVALNGSGTVAIGTDSNEKLIVKDIQNGETPLRECRFYIQELYQNLTVPEGHAHMGIKLDIDDYNVIVEGKLILV